MRFLLKQAVIQDQQYAQKYWEVQKPEVIDPASVTPLEIMLEHLNGVQNSIQVLPAATYLQFDHLSLRNWANRCAVFSIPTTELADWLLQRYGINCIHEIGCGNAALAKHCGWRCSDGRYHRDNEDLQAVYAATDIPNIKVPAWVAKREATEAVKQFRPQVVLAQWVTPGGAVKNLFDGRNSFGPDYAEILKHCRELVFVGNRGIHDSALASVLPSPDEEYNFPWLLSRAKHHDQNFIRIWKGLLK